MRDGDCQHMAAACASNRVAAAARVTESVETGTGEITLIPSNEDDRIAGPSAGIHDCTDGIQQKRIARRNQDRHLGEIARIVRSGRASVHVIALIGADPDVIRNLAARARSVANWLKSTILATRAGLLCTS